jgi:hypothetical protein
MAATNISPAQRVMQGRLAAHTNWARCEDRTAATAPARAAFDARFEKQVDPEGKLPHAERMIRAGHARKAYFARLALASAKARAARAGSSDEVKP